MIAFLMTFLFLFEIGFMMYTYTAFQRISGSISREEGGFVS
jgi:hypothetical protein